MQTKNDYVSVRERSDLSYSAIRQLLLTASPSPSRTISPFENVNESLDGGA
jgi:hypothetical protein